ncbi:MAG: co-chaperone GroES [Bacteroidales bacterium]|nr:co-chaperone GroES [Bacteroidales bacterium]HOZ29723.1 co-chaperone GroES [Bacteroidales bacterium]
MANIGRPMSGKVLIQPQAAEQKTSSGIIIPDSAQEKPQRGKIVAVGNPKKDEKMEVKVGDIVLYGKYSGTEIKIDNSDYLIMNQTDILLVVEE